MIASKCHNFALYTKLYDKCQLNVLLEYINKLYVSYNFVGYHWVVWA